MKSVNSLPDDVTNEGIFFVEKYKRTMLGFIAPAFSYFLVPTALHYELVVLVTLFYLYVVFISKTSRILWQFARSTWFKVFGSLIFGLVAVVFFRFFDINHWLIHEVGYIPDGEVKQYFAAVFFVPLVAAYFDSFKKVELAYYKSKGYDYKGRVGDIFSG
ncbi:hypothetical protein KJY73_18030 [Bowmanella sp. Y26]|uniref:hypothetical protein n=1 Tax=Bowmanella yangjiangensis TaxID=2811230 RepID=UPI001BDCEC37|nr:hypothetical protein [Bowmanella yangjiangensis]MBT1065491.1 hypothetical protein [Bowmanella yangjiangensis]